MVFLLALSLPPPWHGTAQFGGRRSPIPTSLPEIRESRVDLIGNVQLPEGLASVAADLELRQEAVGVTQEHSRVRHTPADS